MGPLENSPDGHHDESLCFLFQHCRPLITAQDVCEEVCHMSKDEPILHSKICVGFQKGGQGGCLTDKDRFICLFIDFLVLINSTLNNLSGSAPCFFCPQHVSCAISATKPTCS